ncbi:MAG: ACT domain-containing protein, partial [Candidatus Obscuribacterales bacterium]|nr:ACT domain-containing protein [Candidatus Obscuribacterales bacterium]
LKERLCQAEDKLGMNVFVRELSSDELMEDESGLAPYILSVYGADQPGIVAGITRVLARLSVNLTDVETKKTPG